MTCLRKLARLFRRAVATVDFGQGTPQSVTLKSRVATSFPTPTPPRRMAGKGLVLCVIAAAASANGCADPSSRLADEPTVVDIVWTDGRMEMSNSEAFTEGHDGPVAFRIIEDGEIVKEFAGANLAEAHQKLQQASVDYLEEMAGRPDASRAMRALIELMESIPSDSSIRLMTDDQRTRLLETMEPLLAADYADMPAEEQARVLSGVKEAVNAVKSDVAKDS